MCKILPKQNHLFAIALAFLSTLLPQVLPAQLAPLKLERMAIYTNLTRPIMREYGLGIRYRIGEHEMLELDGAWKMRNPNAKYSYSEWDFYESPYPLSNGYRLRAGLRYAGTDEFRHCYLAAHVGYLQLVSKNVADYWGLEFNEYCERYWLLQQKLTWSLTGGIRARLGDQVGLDFLLGFGFATGVSTWHYQHAGTMLWATGDCANDASLPQDPRVERTWSTEPLALLGVRLDVVLWQ